MVDSSNDGSVVRSMVHSKVKSIERDKWLRDKLVKVLIK